MAAAAAVTGDRILGGYGMLLLPKTAVKPGDIWTETETNSLPVPGAKGRAIKMTTRSRFTLKKLVEQDGHQIAVIDSVSTTTGGHTPVKGKNADMALDKSVEKITGTTQFDVDRGEVVAGDYKVNVQSVMSASARQAPSGPKPATPGSTGAPQMNLGPSKITLAQTGTIQVKRRGAAEAVKH
jgi:hypothetical protein